MHGFGVPILSVLDQKYHEERDYCRGGVYDQLPSVGEMKCRTGENPNENSKYSRGKRPGAAEHHGRTPRKDTKCVSDDTK